MFCRAIADTPGHAPAATMDQSKQVDCGRQIIAPSMQVGPVETIRKAA
jgi:hypothetical protein